ncbi:hypothetical protein B6U80_01460 [Candidatus Pacearchaeota archaeon ex4484_26]|nr:MAG: hypothetical protein B6U80_01460 [Candidatus Pacearchaeota archaeon ex4484_26]
MKKANIFKTTLLYGALGLAGILSSFGGLASTSNTNNTSSPQSKIHEVVPNIEKEEIKEKDIEAITNLHKVQLAIERYAAYNPTGEYPPDLQTLIDEGYMHEWPKNPYAKGNPGVFLRMHQVDLGNFMPGGIIYDPYKYPGYKGLSGYHLSVYGATPDSGRQKILIFDESGKHQQRLLIWLSSHPEPRGVF